MQKFTTMYTKGCLTSQVTDSVKICPRQVTETYTSSVTFMKQITVVFVSMIAYMKNIFPEESFTLESFAGIKLRILKTKCRHETAHFVSTTLTQAFEAFEKKYLHKLAICFYDGECKAENLVEYHIFEYLYYPDGVTMNVHSKTRDSDKRSMRYTYDNIQKCTGELLKAYAVFLLDDQKKMPESFDISLRLYYNEDAPEGYQAPGFLSTTEDDHLEPTVTEHKTNMGYLETPYHRMNVRAYLRDSMGSSHEANPSLNTPKMTQYVEEEDFRSSSAVRNVSDSSEMRIQCPCNKNDADDGMHTILTCQYCNSQQHATCFGLTAESAARVARHCCTACSDAEPDREPTDPQLAACIGSVHKRESLAVLRRTIEWITRLPAIGAQDLMDKFTLPTVNAAKIMKWLHTRGVIKKGSDSDLVSPCKIKHDKLKSLMSEFFPHEEPYMMVDRLIAETLSQSSQPDPVAEVLSPMEKVNLQNATTLGKIIEPEIVKEVEDKTLKEYRDALLSELEKENGLPLSGSHNPVNVEDLGKRTGKRKLDTKRTGVRTKRAKISRD